MIQNVFCDCAVIEIGCRLYFDNTGEVPAAAGKYSDGTNCYNVDSLGYVTSFSVCGETTTTTSTSTTTTSTTTTSTTTTSTTTTSTTTTTLAPSPDITSGSFNSAFSVRGTGSLYRLTNGAGGFGCLLPNWTSGSGVLNIGGSGQEAYTVYSGSLTLTGSASSYNPTIIVNGISVPGLIFYPLDSTYPCGQSPLFITKIESGVSSSAYLLPNTSISVNNGTKIQYWAQGNGSTIFSPQLYAITGSSYTFTSAGSRMLNMYLFEHTFTSSGNFYYNSFTRP